MDCALIQTSERNDRTLGTGLERTCFIYGVADTYLASIGIARVRVLIRLPDIFQVKVQHPMSSGSRIFVS
ncbi:hypothetical protein C8J56DRAFT_806070 [Mycena floridula]|nr:hypothetical protein C8J56DRAFT_806070 [Mycena floridula]